MSLIIGDCRGSDYLSRTIGWFGGGYYSHSTTLFPRNQLAMLKRAKPDYDLSRIPSTGWLVIDSRNDEVGGAPPGVQVRSANYLKHNKERVTWRHIPCTRAQELIVYAALISQLGKPYDKVGILEFVTGALKDRNWRSENAWFCSEIRTWSWIEASLLPAGDYPEYLPSRITPGDSARIAWGLQARVIASPI